MDYLIKSKGVIELRNRRTGRRARKYKVVEVKKG
jgi:hypothetical protein